MTCLFLTCFSFTLAWFAPCKSTIINLKIRIMEKISLNTSLFPIADVAMYGTILDSGEMEYYLNQDEEDEMEINQDKYEKELVYVSSEFIKDNVLETFKKYGIVSIDNFSLYSPSCYNYNNDMLCFDVTLSDDFDDIMKKYISEFEKEEKYKNYIEEHWKSRSGFISFMQPGKAKTDLP